MHGIVFHSGTAVARWRLRAIGSRRTTLAMRTQSQVNVLPLVSGAPCTESLAVLCNLKCGKHPAPRILLTCTGARFSRVLQII